MTRFDLTADQRKFLNDAVTLGVVDAAELFCLGTQSDDFDDVLCDVLDAAFAMRHHDAHPHHELSHQRDLMLAKARRA